ncbi:hypothetical protein POM88_028057 [Heracleum sosnowskyi]|uniref:SAM-dependent methyltransferase Erg6/SMT-type domain-containing protein n=1 Tax=Heracleum sosnowskyi TaxID=360622 RepID=A0AAD8IBE7_9APIA|nr:hypothetical protein POM88_028057 [Heracleum sosnowskyi]
MEKVIWDESGQYTSVQEDYKFKQAQKIRNPKNRLKKILDSCKNKTKCGGDDIESQSQDTDEPVKKSRGGCGAQQPKIMIEDQKVLDVGCGIGGPLREIARFSATSVTGLNNNEYQITRGKKLNRVAEVDQTCDFVKGNFMKMLFPDNNFETSETS